MKIYLVVIDNGDDTLDISSTYTWLIEPQVVVNQYDILALCWENGTYITGSAERFCSYWGNTPTDTSKYYEYFTDFGHSSAAPKQVHVAYHMDDSTARREVFLYFKVTIERDTGVASENVYSHYKYQEQHADWASVLQASAKIGSAAYAIIIMESVAISNLVLGTVAIISGASLLASSLDQYYEVASASTTISF